MKLLKLVGKPPDVLGCLLDRLERLEERTCETAAYFREASNGSSTSDSGERVTHTAKMSNSLKIRDNNATEDSRDVEGSSERRWIIYQKSSIHFVGCFFNLPRLVIRGRKAESPLTPYIDKWPMASNSSQCHMMVQPVIQQNSVVATQLSCIFLFQYNLSFIIRQI